MIMKLFGLGTLLSFNGGFVDTTGFLGLQGLFTAHVTGNFVTLGATVAFGSHGAIAKLAALPEFVLIVAAARIAGSVMRSRGLPALRILLGTKVALLLAFCVLAVALGPFPNSDAPAALLTAFAGIAAMAIQNATQRVHYARIPPTTLMTGNTTQAVLDAVDLIHGVDPERADTVRARFWALVRAIVSFAAGCLVAAALYAWVGFYCLVVAVIVGAASAVVRVEE
jgi:uncharacterized membrane protein YoaK (UPF0700 family)